MNWRDKGTGLSTRGWENTAIGEVPRDRGGIAGGWRAVAAGTWRDDFDRVAGMKNGAAGAGKRDPFAEFEGAAPARFSAFQSPGRREQPRTVDPQLASASAR